ncbi:hypothetical protein B0T16DRAFT_145460 [Cercophora newfieldiana]|uniref:Uncharacterized protein n=1 Tax=Cercophora newfieldiana TaxID=92897 RepID=A0AA40CP87_9PEZI|nr:hypothetical protein B0T16DRAFT_145460 [Cercophora newfieldiana]
MLRGSRQASDGHTSGVRQRHRAERTENIHRSADSIQWEFTVPSAQAGLLPARLSLSRSPRPLCTWLISRTTRPSDDASIRPSTTQAPKRPKGRGRVVENQVPRLSQPEVCLGTGKNPVSASRKLVASVFFLFLQSQTRSLQCNSHPRHSRSVCNKLQLSPWGERLGCQRAKISKVWRFHRAGVDCGGGGRNSRQPPFPPALLPVPLRCTNDTKDAVARSELDCSTRTSKVHTCSTGRWSIFPSSTGMPIDVLPRLEASGTPRVL